MTETLYGTIVARTGMVSITGYDGETAYIYGIDGKIVKSAQLVGNHTDVPVNAGIYVVKVANRVVKVVVK